VQGDACEVLGELLRCSYRRRIEGVIDDAVARVAATVNLSRFSTEAAEARVRATLESSTLEELLGLLWGTTARAAESGSCPQRTIATSAGDLAETLGVLISLCSCPDADGLQILHSGFRITREDGSGIELCPSLPEEHISAYTAQTRASRFGDRFSGPGSAAEPMILICAGTVGELPPKVSKVSLVGSRPAAGIGAGNRTPADVIGFDELDRRFGEVSAAAPSLGQILRT
jgi:hypothetical protein